MIDSVNKTVTIDVDLDNQRSLPKAYLVDRGAWELNDYSACKTRRAGCYYGPETDPGKVMDTDGKRHNVGSNVCGRTVFRSGEAPYRARRKFSRLKKLDDGTAHSTHGGETTKGPWRIDDRAVATTRRAEAVACQVGLPDWHKREVRRLIGESDLRAWNWLGGVDTAILGIIAYVLRDESYVVSNPEMVTIERKIVGPEDTLEHPCVQQAIEILPVEDPEKAIAFTFDKFD